MDYIGTYVTNYINFSFWGFIFGTTVVRLLCRRYLVPPLGLDDVYIVVSVIFGLGFIIVLHYEMSAWEAVYRSIEGLPAEQQGIVTDNQWHDYGRAVLLTIFDNSFQLIALTFAKLSLLAFYRRMATASKAHRRILIALEVILICNMFTTILPLCFSTRPLICYYDLENHRNCQWVIKTTYLLMANSGVQILIDLACFTLPWFVLWKLRITTTLKIRILAMYSVGAVAVAFSAIRIKAIHNEGLAFEAYLKSQFQFALWSVIEAFAPAVCVNIPAIFGGLTKFKSMRKSGRLPEEDKKKYLLESGSGWSSTDTYAQPPTFASRTFQSFSSENDKYSSDVMASPLEFKTTVKDGNWL